MCNCKAGLYITFPFSLEEWVLNDELWVDDGLAVKARVKEAVLSKKSFLWPHFLPPMCWSKYIFCPNFLWQEGQVNVRDLDKEDDWLGGSEHLDLCLDKPEALYYKKLLVIFVAYIYFYFTWCIPSHSDMYAAWTH